MALKIDGDDLRELRKEHGWTLRQLADKAGNGVHYSYLSKLENNQGVQTRAETIRAIASALGCDPRAITGNKQQFAAALKAVRADPAALRTPAKAAA